MRFTRSAIILVTALSATAPALAGECKTLRAEDVSFQVPPAQCGLPAGFCAVGEIRGNLGLHGETQFQVLSISAIDGAPPATHAFTGRIVITTDRGDLHLDDVGVFDTANGTLSSVSTVSAGSGRYFDATGTLFLAATVDPDGAFVSRVQGTLCR